MRSEPTSPTMSFSGNSTSSRFSWNPYNGGSNVQQWLHNQCTVRLPSALSPPTSELALPPGHNGGMLRNTSVQLSDGFSQTMSDMGDNVSTPRRRDGTSPNRAATSNRSRRADAQRPSDVPHAPAPLVSSDLIDSEAMEAIGRLRKIKRDENVPNQFRRYNKGMQRRITAAVASNEALLLELCECDRGNIVVTIVETCGSASPTSPMSHCQQAQGQLHGAPSPHASMGASAALSNRTSPTQHSPGSASGRRGEPRVGLARSATSMSDDTSSAELVLSIVMQNSWRLCTSQGGCIAMTRILDVMPAKQRALLEDFVVDNFLALAVHPYGNYVVQTILQQRQGDDESVLRAILIHVSIPSSVVAIASNKFGSHVLEAFFRYASPVLCCTAMQRLLADEATVQFLVCDKFGNYVIQQGMRRLTKAVSQQMGTARSTPQPNRHEDGVLINGAVAIETTPAELRSPPAMGATIEMLPTNVDLVAMREAFISVLEPHLDESAFCHNISKTFAIRKSPSPAVGSTGPCTEGPVTTPRDAASCTV